MNNYSITRFTGIDYDNGKQAKWTTIAERASQEQALATCKFYSQEKAQHFSKNH